MQNKFKTLGSCLKRTDLKTIHGGDRNPYWPPPPPPEYRHLCRICRCC